MFDDLELFMTAVSVNVLSDAGLPYDNHFYFPVDLPRVL